MPREMKPAQTIDGYIANYPDTQQELLRQMRKTIRASVPGLEEKISYGIPTFTLRGKNVVHIGAYENFVSFYPGSGPVEAFADELKGFVTSKGTIQFPLDQPLPLDLITRITQFRANQIA